MAKTFTSWGALKGALQKEVRSAMTEVVTKSFEDARTNVDNFYNSPEGIYQRTGQLAESPEMALSGGGDSVSCESRLNTGFNYDPAGRDTRKKMYRKILQKYSEENLIRRFYKWKV